MCLISMYNYHVVVNYIFKTFKIQIIVHATFKSNFYGHKFNTNLITLHIIVSPLSPSDHWSTEEVYSNN